MTDRLSMPWRSAFLVAFDFETTGVDPDTSKIIEFGLAAYDGGQLMRRASMLLDPGFEVPPKITEITGIQTKDVAGQPRFEEASEKILSWLSAGTALVAFNHEFDRNMLAGNLRQIGQDKRARIVDKLGPFLDPLPFFWKLYTAEKKAANAKLGTAVEVLGLDVQATHRADDDAVAAGAVLHALGELHDLPETIGGLLELQGQYAEERAKFYNYWGKR